MITLSPYFVLTALLIYTARLPGAVDGINFYLTPDWDKLQELDVWTTAASQADILALKHASRILRHCWDA